MSNMQLICSALLLALCARFVDASVPFPDGLPHEFHGRSP